MEVACLAAIDTYSPATTEGMKVMFRKAKMRGGENVVHLESLILEPEVWLHESVKSQVRLLSIATQTNNNKSLPTNTTDPH